MNSFHKEITVTVDDLDDLNHVNNVRYVQWIQDISKEHWQAKAPEKDNKKPKRGINRGNFATSWK